MERFGRVRTSEERLAEIEAQIEASEDLEANRLRGTIHQINALPPDDHQHTVTVWNWNRTLEQHGPTALFLMPGGAAEHMLSLGPLGRPLPTSSPSLHGRASAGQPIRSRYADNTPVFEGQQPARLPAYSSSFDPAAQGQAHTVLRWDRVNGRVYQAREYGVGNVPIRDIDFMNPTYPSGAVRPGHPGPPHQHTWRPVHPSNPGAGYIRDRNPTVYP
jgi:hypothetical protein